MCGIAGVMDLSGHPVAPELLERVNRTMTRRGPDGEGYWYSPAERDKPACALAQRRLAIIDVEGGKQPLASEDGTIQAVVNGEFYNYPALRRELEAAGHRFSTDSDSEALIHLYEEEGLKAVERLRGMFALALWDQNQGRLFLARDRMGQKPLHWFQDGQRIIFASEIKALLADPGCPRQFNTAALGRWLRWLYLPGEETFIQGVHRLAPGHLAVVDASGIQTRPYWELKAAPQKMDAAEAMAEFDRRLSQATLMRLMSDVPLGAFLSGGIDSSLICALMAQGGGRPRTFTVSFGEASHDESAKAARVAAHLGTDHTVVPVRPDLPSAFEDIVAGLDEPMADSSAIPTYWLCKATRQHVTVALSGDGGDELLAGYRRYVGRRLAERYNLVPGPLRALAGWGVGLLPQPSTYMGKSPIKKARMFIDQAAMVATKPDTSRINYLSPAEISDFLGSEVLSRPGFQADPVAELFSRCPLSDPVARMQWADCLSYLPDDILIKVDRMAMANSLEVRSPLMDHELIDWLAGVPVELKLKGLTTKWLMKRAAQKYLPREIIEQPKQGFVVPLAGWFRGELKDWLAGKLNRPLLEQAGLVRDGAISRMIKAHQSGREDRSQELWGLAVMEAWLDRFKISL